MLPHPPLRYIDCSGKYFEAVIYQHESNEDMVIYMQGEKQPLNKYFKA